MNKRTASIAYYSCLAAALLVSYCAFNYASDVALSGKQPSLWVNMLAFFAAILLVLVAIFVKVKYRK